MPPPSAATVPTKTTPKMSNRLATPADAPDAAKTATPIRSAMRPALLPTVTPPVRPRRVATAPAEPAEISSDPGRMTGRRCRRSPCTPGRPASPASRPWSPGTCSPHSASTIRAEDGALQRLRPVDVVEHLRPGVGFLDDPGVPEPRAVVIRCHLQRSSVPECSGTVTNLRRVPPNSGRPGRFVRGHRAGCRSPDRVGCRRRPVRSTRGMCCCW